MTPTQKAQKALEPTESGQIVKYSSPFLRSIGSIAGDVPQFEGEVIELRPIPRTEETMAKVVWQDGEATFCRTCNLVLSDKLHLEPR